MRFNLKKNYNDVQTLDLINSNFWLIPQSNFTSFSKKKDLMKYYKVWKLQDTSFKKTTFKQLVPSFYKTSCLITGIQRSIYYSFFNKTFLKTSLNYSKCYLFTSFVNFFTKFLTIVNFAIINLLVNWKVFSNTKLFLSNKSPTFFKKSTNYYNFKLKLL